MDKEKRKRVKIEEPLIITKHRIYFDPPTGLYAGDFAELEKNKNTGMYDIVLQINGIQQFVFRPRKAEIIARSILRLIKMCDLSNSKVEE